MTLNYHEIHIEGILLDGNFSPVSHSFSNPDQAIQASEILRNKPVLPVGLKCRSCCAFPEGGDPSLECDIGVNDNTLIFTVACMLASRYLDGREALRHNLKCAEGSTIAIATNSSLPESYGVSDVAGGAKE